MIVKLVLKLIVIFSLINSIQCICHGSQAILDAISQYKSNSLDAMNELSERLKAVEKEIDFTLELGIPCKIGKFIDKIA